MSVSRAVLGDPFTWGAFGVTAVAFAAIAARFPLGNAELLMLAGFAIAQFIGWIALATATGRYRRRWNESQLEQAREQLEKSQQRVDSLRLAFTRVDFELGADRLQKLVESYSGFRRAIGHWRAGSQQSQRRLSELAGECYVRGLAQLESLSGLVRTLQDTNGQVTGNPDADRLLGNSDLLADELVAISLSFSDSSPDVAMRAETRLVTLLKRLDDHGAVHSIEDRS